MAYAIKFYQLSAPDWMSNARFSLQAKVPEGTEKQHQEAMLRTLLEERFRLAAHRETREIQQYNLVVAKGGPKFKQAGPQLPEDDITAGPVPIKLGPDGYPVLPHRQGFSMAIMYDRARLYAPDMTMEKLAEQVAGQLQKPVTDATGLKGHYEVSLYWSADNGTRTDANTDPGPALEAALREQLGLRLESKKGPVDFVVVDSADRLPQDN